MQMTMVEFIVCCDCVGAKQSELNERHEKKKTTTTTKEEEGQKKCAERETMTMTMMMAMRTNYMRNYYVYIYRVVRRHRTIIVDGFYSVIFAPFIVVVDYIIVFFI